MTIRHLTACIAALLAALMLAAGAFAAEALKAGDIDPKTGKKIKYWVAPMDPTYIRNEPGQSPMGMDLVPVYEEEGGEKLPSSTIRIDPVTVQNMGVRTATVRRESLSRTIRALGNITFDERRIYAVNTKFDGWIEELYVDFIGEDVRRGQRLFEIYSPELVTAQEEYKLALKQMRQLGDSDYDTVRDGAERLLRAARTRLQYWDFTPQQIEQLAQDPAVRKNLTIYSPASGVVIAKNAMQGHYVKAGQHLYEIADLSTVWVDVEVYEYELPYVTKGMDARMELSYLPGKDFFGKVIFIYPFLSPETRTARLRLEFPNPEGELKPDMYANVYLESAVAPDAVVVPQEAVIDSGVRKVVFVDQGKGRFEPREVRIGAEGEGVYQVLEGLEGGEKVVTSAQFMLDSESRLREAIQKMMEARSAGAEPDTSDMDMSDMDMGGLDMSDMDMSDMTMDQ